MNPKQTGFTLVEVLVTMVVTGIIFSSVMVSYMSFNTMNRKINHWRQLQKEANFAMIRMTDKVREFSINYDGYEDTCSNDENIDFKCACSDLATQSNTKLCVGNGNSAKYHFFIEDTGKLNMDDQPLFSDLFKVDQVLFFNVTPICDPSLTKTELQEDSSLCSISSDRINEITSQPKVTIYMKVSSRQDPDITMTLQTTVSARVYNF